MVRVSLRVAILKQSLLRLFFALFGLKGSDEFVLDIAGNEFVAGKLHDEAGAATGE